MKQLLVLLVFLCSASVAWAQDVIVKKDGSTIVCRVVEVSSTEVVYKKWSNLNGSNYIMDRSLVSSINYENGRKEEMSEMSSQYSPGNQSDGDRQMNDRALLALDIAQHGSTQKAKTLRTVGLIGGGAAIATGIVFVLVGGQHTHFFDFGGDGGSANAGVACIVGGAGLIVGTQLAARNDEKKQYERLQSRVLFHNEFKFGNGSSFTAGIDVLKDNNRQSQTLGLGLCYNF